MSVCVDVREVVGLSLVACSGPDTPTSSATGIGQLVGARADACTAQAVVELSGLPGKICESQTTRLAAGFELHSYDAPAVLRCGD